MSVGTLSLFEAKTHFSHLVQEVAESHNEVVVTVRGQPKVRIVPYDTSGPSDVWEIREQVIAEYGSFDFTALPRSSEPAKNPFFESDS